jgi:hypothetical protein
LYFSRSLYDYAFCLASYDRFFKAPKSGVVTITPAFSATWMGAYDSLKINRLYTAAFILEPWLKERFLWITSDQYRKDGISRNDDGTVSFYGEYQQFSKDGPTPLQLVSNVAEGEELSVCLGYLTRGTEFTLDSIHMHYVPDSSDTELTSKDYVNTLLADKNIELAKSKRNVESLETAISVIGAFKLMTEVCNLLYGELTATGSHELFSTVKNIVSFVPNMITLHKESFSDHQIQALIRLKTLSDALILPVMTPAAETSYLDLVFSDEDREILRSLYDLIPKNSEHLNTLLKEEIEKHTNLNTEIEALTRELEG